MNILNKSIKSRNGNGDKEMQTFDKITSYPYKTNAF